MDGPQREGPSPGPCACDLPQPFVILFSFFCLKQKRKTDELFSRIQVDLKIIIIKKNPTLIKLNSFGPPSAITQLLEYNGPRPTREIKVKMQKWGFKSDRIVKEYYPKNISKSFRGSIE